MPGTLAKGDLSYYGEPVNILGIQMDIAWEDKQRNFSTVRRLLDGITMEEGSLLVLPEMFATGFSMNVAAIAEPYHGEIERFLIQLAKEFRCFVVAGAAMRSASGKIQNKALLFAPNGELIGFYAKMRPFAPGGEAQHYRAGQKPIAVSLGGTVAAPFVCYDLRFPELFRQIAATDRPEVFVVIASWPEKRILHWVRLLQARAIENQAYVIGVNRVGSDPFYKYSGRSIIVDYNGDILADAGTAEGLLRSKIDVDQLHKYREGLPFLADLKL